MTIDREPVSRGDYSGGVADMAKFTKERRGELQREVLRVLSENPDGVQAKDVIELVKRRLTLTDHEKEDWPNNPGEPRFPKLLRFSTIGLVKAGWMTKERGVWTITETGLQALKEYPEAADLQREVGRLYRAWKESQPEDDVETEDEDTSGSTTIEEAEENAWAEIRTLLENMNPYDFQHLVAGLLAGMGYHVAWVSPPGPDKGLDVLAYEDPLGVRGPRIKAQVKRTVTSKVNAESLRAFMSTLGDGDVGLFVAAGGFSREAEKEARYQEFRRVTLLDLQGLFELWVENYDSVPEEVKRLLPLRFIPYLAPEV